MALISCKNCGAEVALSAPTCPKCGINHPGIRTGSLVINRLSKNTGRLAEVQVSVDGSVMGVVKSGITLTLELPAGERRVQVSGAGSSAEATITITEGQVTQYQMYFNPWGFGLCGRLVFVPAT
jgi:hypothetical protein